jgi:hypothetical protein
MADFFAPSPQEEDIMTRKRLVGMVVSATVGLLIAGAVAYAAWTVNGSGTGTASATSAVALTLSGGTPQSSLYPGATADVDTSAQNQNPFPVHVSSIALDTSQGTDGFSVDAGHSGCNLSSLSFTTADNGSAGWDIPANSSIDIDAADSVAMSSAANDSCQGATFTVYLTADAATQ